MRRLEGEWRARRSSLSLDGSAPLSLTPFFPIPLFAIAAPRRFQLPTGGEVGISLAQLFGRRRAQHFVHRGIREVARQGAFIDRLAQPATCHARREPQAFQLLGAVAGRNARVLAERIHGAYPVGF